MSAWLPGSTALPCHSPRSHTGLEHSPGQTQAKAEHCSLSQAIARLKINQLQSPKLLVKYFPFKMTLYGKRETFHKQWTSSDVSWHGLSCSLPRQCPGRGGSRREVWAAPSLPHSQSKQPAAFWQMYKPPLLPSEGTSSSCSPSWRRLRSHRRKRVLDAVCVWMLPPDFSRLWKGCKHKLSFGPNPADLSQSQLNEEGPWVTITVPWSNSCFPQHRAQRGAHRGCWKRQPCCFTLGW